MDKIQRRNFATPTHLHMQVDILVNIATAINLQAGTDIPSLGVELSPVRIRQLSPGQVFSTNKDVNEGEPSDRKVRH